MEEETEYVPYVSAAEKRRQQLEKQRSKRCKNNKRVIDEDSESVVENVKVKSLVQQSKELKEANPNFELDRQKREEEAFLAAVKAKQSSLLSVEERAKGKKYLEPIETGWRPTKRIRNQSSDNWKKTREKMHIYVEGEDIPPPVNSFKRMRIPRVLRSALEKKGIKSPTPIQVQGLPVALSGRDMVGIAFTGSGKTMTFVLPLVLMSLGEEIKLPLNRNEGPVGLILGPSRELMTQTYELVEYLCDTLKEDRKFPAIRSILLIGGQDKRTQLAQHRSQGSHIVVATPGRLNDMLNRKDINLDICRYFCLDEGDRMMDDGFDEEVQTCLGYFKLQRQTLLFSATMPRKFVEFAKSCLIKPVTVNVSRAGAANLDVTQQVEFVRPDGRIVYLLDCLQKSPPPVIIFCESKADVDMIVEYLLLKGVDAIGIHGGKSQEERSKAISDFKSDTKDILVATDVAAKGLDFPNIRHVINFDMPSEIENYVHRIGRTGRSGKRGIATTFVNNTVDKATLLDLKLLLKEAKQKIPKFLEEIGDPIINSSSNAANDTSCAFCGGPGHRITDCPKLKGNIRNRTTDIIGNSNSKGS